MATEHNVAIFAFVMLNLGIGVASWVFPLLLSRNSLENYSILYNVGSWVGGSMPVIVVYLTITRQTLAWRVAYGGVGGLLLLIFIISIFLIETPKSKLNKERLKTASFSPLFKRSSLPSLIITVVSSTITVFSIVGVLQFYGPLLFSSANLSAEDYMPPLLIFSIQILFRTISIIIVRFRGRKELLVVAALIKIMSEAYMAAVFHQTSSRFTFFKDPRHILIPGGIYVAADACLTATSGWLERAFPDDMKDQGAMIFIILGLLQNAIMTFISIVAFCKLGGNIFYVFIVFDFFIICFILKLVPETTKVELDEVWSSHKIWGRFVKHRNNVL
ncbi:hypothetical protein RND81_11G083300 [Saponaria officinalis]|uniref:Uncharacterized protein n=1 Tax=Saponaria officinalis TaxID=3572 RepID=A0AAW1HIH2_SAPOF